MARLVRSPKVGTQHPIAVSPLAGIPRRIAVIPKPDRISVLEALKRIREIYHVDAPTAEEIFIQIVRNGTVPLWEKRDGRYQEVWYWDEVERCSIHGQSEAALGCVDKIDSQIT